MACIAYGRLMRFPRMRPRGEMTLRNGEDLDPARYSQGGNPLPNRIPLGSRKKLQPHSGVAGGIDEDLEEIRGVGTIDLQQP